MFLNRLVHQQSTAWIIASWIVLAALTADAINLDDLIPGVYVAHDEVEATSPDLSFSMTFAGSFQSAHRSSNIAQTNHDGSGKTGRDPRIVFDEDSPSEAVEPFETMLLAIFVDMSEQTAMPEATQTASPLHLLNCTLLI